MYYCELHGPYSDFCRPCDAPVEPFRLRKRISELEVKDSFAQQYGLKPLKGQALVAHYRNCFLSTLASLYALFDSHTAAKKYAKRWKALAKLHKLNEKHRY